MDDKIKDIIEAYLDNIINDFDDDTDRDELIDRLDEETDNAFGRLVKQRRIDEYTVSDMTETAEDCSRVIKFAEENAWVEDDHGLWEGLTYGVLASIAYFSLRNCFYQLLSNRGINSNDDFPFAVTV